MMGPSCEVQTFTKADTKDKYRDDLPYEDDDDWWESCKLHTWYDGDGTNRIVNDDNRFAEFEECFEGADNCWFLDSTHILFLIVGVMLVFPLILGMIISNSCASFFHMLKSFIPFYMMVPMIVSWFGAYSFARTWDLSWGNRPSDQMEDIDQKKKMAVQNKFKRCGANITVAVVIMNMAVFIMSTIDSIRLNEYILWGIGVMVIYEMVFSFLFFLWNRFKWIGWLCERCCMYCCPKSDEEEEEGSEDSEYMEEEEVILEQMRGEDGCCSCCRKKRPDMMANQSFGSLAPPFPAGAGAQPFIVN